MNWLRSRLTAGVPLLILGCLVLAQLDASPVLGQDPPLPPPKEKTEPRVLPDPTEPSPRLKDAMDKGKTVGPTAARMPQVVLRGRVVVKDRPQTAMLEVDGKLSVVAKGSTLSGAGNTVLRVTDLTRTEVRIEVSPLNETITLR